jgi:hypothetical protein
MSVKNYLSYVHKCLGLTGVMISPHLRTQLETSKSIPPQVDLTTAPQVDLTQANEIMPLGPESLSLQWESEPVQNRRYLALFVRISSGLPSLREDSQSRELFDNLRKALDFDSNSAPWVEAPLECWADALVFLRGLAPRIIIMTDDQVLRGSESIPEWRIPDPSVLVLNQELKRPTWALLKEWKIQT